MNTSIPSPQIVIPPSNKQPSQELIYENKFPGDSDLFYLTAANTGALILNIENGSEQLTEVLKLHINNLSTGSTLYDSILANFPSNLSVSENDKLECRLYLDTTVGNEYQNKSGTYEIYITGLICATINYTTGQISIDLNGRKPLVNTDMANTFDGFERNFYCDNAGTWDVYVRFYISDISGGLADYTSLLIYNGDKFLGIAGTKRNPTSWFNLGIGRRQALTVVFAVDQSNPELISGLEMSFIFCAEAVQAKNNPAQAFGFTDTASTAQNSICEMRGDFRYILDQSNITTGTHQLTIVATAPGYEDGDPSTAIEVYK